MSVVIHHNPACGTSRNTLAMIRASGVEPVIVEYLRTGWTRPQLQALFAGAGLTPRAALRVNNTPAGELGLTDPSASDDAILEAMVAHPVLVERPIVVTRRGIRLCRPSETVLEILENPHFGRFTKEDGEVVETGRA